MLLRYFYLYTPFDFYSNYLDTYNFQNFGGIYAILPPFDQKYSITYKTFSLIFHFRLPIESNAESTFCKLEFDSALFIYFLDCYDLTILVLYK